LADHLGGRRADDDRPVRLESEFGGLRWNRANHDQSSRDGGRHDLLQTCEHDFPLRIERLQRIHISATSAVKCKPCPPACDELRGRL
jgi:hypothetical protein